MRAVALPILMSIAICPAFMQAQSDAASGGEVATASAAQGSSATPVIHATTRLVYEDVTVRDSQGRPVHGLKLKDFKLEEDGAAQQIDYFDESVSPSGTIEKVPQAIFPQHTNPAHSSASPSSGDAREFSNASAADSSSSAVNIILFDLLNTPHLDQLEARRALLKFLTALPTGQQVALYVLADKLRMFQNFTYSSDRLIQAAKAIDPKNMMLIDSKLDTAQANDFVTQFAQAIGGRDPGGAAAALKAQNDQTTSYALSARLTSTQGALNEIALATSGHPGRKNLLWLSESFPVTLGVQAETLRGGSVVQPADARQTTNLLSTAQIAVYPISLLGLETDGVPIGSSGLGQVSLVGGPMGSTMHPQANDTFKDQMYDRAALRAGMHDLADNTGGEAFVGTNDFARALRLSMEDGSNYYTLAYRPGNPKWDGNFRKIRVKLAKSGYSLSYRRGYFAIDSPGASPDSAQELNVALQPDAPESAALLLKAKVSQQPASGVLQVASTLDPANLALLTTPDGHKRGQILVLLVAMDDAKAAQAEHSAGGQQATFPQTSAVLNLDFNPDLYKKLLASGIGFTQQLKLQPGRYRLRLGVEDLQSHRLGTLEMPFQVGAGQVISKPTGR